MHFKLLIHKYIHIFHRRLLTLKSRDSWWLSSANDLAINFENLRWKEPIKEQSSAITTFKFRDKTD
jgi:hypothetical protein